MGPRVQGACVEVPRCLRFGRGGGTTGTRISGVGERSTEKGADGVRRCCWPSHGEPQIAKGTDAAYSSCIMVQTRKILKLTAESGVTQSIHQAPRLVTPQPT